MMFREFFTPKEANKRLPLVKKIVKEILHKGHDVRELLKNNEGQQTSESLMLVDEIETLMKELEDLGCFYKDWNFEIGLVDFPATIDGEEVFLCWRSDEPEILWYHGIEEGYAGRKPLPAQWLLGDVFKSS